MVSIITLAFVKAIKTLESVILLSYKSEDYCPESFLKRVHSSYDYDGCIDYYFHFLISFVAKLILPLLLVNVVNRSTFVSLSNSLMISSNDFIFFLRGFCFCFSQPLIILYHPLGNKSIFFWFFLDFF